MGKQPINMTEEQMYARILEELQNAKDAGRLDPDIRVEKVARAKAQILAGTYETPERIDAAVEGIMEELGL